MAIELDVKSWEACFVCDRCKKPIVVGGSAPGSGIAIFNDPQEGKPTAFFFVHRKCDPRGGNWQSLEMFIEELAASLKPKERAA